MKQSQIILLVAGCLCLADQVFPQQAISPDATQQTLPADSLVPKAATPLAKVCGCYFDRDCKGRISTCDLGQSCIPQGKNNGLCNIAGTPDPLRNADTLSEAEKKLLVADRLAILSALDAYFRSFIKAIENGGGHPDARLVQAALDVRLSEKGHENVDRAVWVSLDAVMGWDFQYPTIIQRTEGFVGNIREVDGVRAASAIVDATRRALLDAVKSGDSDKVTQPLQDFWAQNPGYMPRHLGRCYPHGHPEIGDIKTSVACQVDTLQRVAGMLIDTANSAAKQVSEEKEKESN